MSSLDVNMSDVDIDAIDDEDVLKLMVIIGIVFSLVVSLILYPGCFKSTAAQTLDCPLMRR